MKLIIILTTIAAMAGCGAEPGADGSRGAPGTTCTVVSADGCTTIDCGTDVATVCDGEDGNDGLGVPGEDGATGQDGAPGQDGQDATLPRHPCLDTPYLSDPLFVSCSAGLDFLTWTFGDTDDTCHAVNYDTPSVDHYYECGDFPTLLMTATATTEAVTGGCILAPLTPNWFDVDAVEPTPLTWMDDTGCTPLADGSLFCPTGGEACFYVGTELERGPGGGYNRVCIYNIEACEPTVTGYAESIMVRFYDIQQGPM